MNCLNAENNQKSLSFIVLKIFDFYFRPLVHGTLSQWPRGFQLVNHGTRMGHGICPVTIPLPSPFYTCHIALKMFPRSFRGHDLLHFGLVAYRSQRVAVEGLGGRSENA